MPLIVFAQIRKVLELMEEHGGPNALKFIKNSIPLCEIITTFQNSEMLFGMPNLTNFASKIII